MSANHTFRCCDCKAPLELEPERIARIQERIASGSTLLGIRCPGCAAKDTAKTEERERLAAEAEREAATWALEKGRHDWEEILPPMFAWAFNSEPYPNRLRPELLERIANTLLGIRYVLSGPAGSGKTSLACAMLGKYGRHQRYRGRPCFASSWDIGRARMRFKLGDGDPPEVDRAKIAPVLILDDLGAERMNRDGDVEDVIYHRHARLLPTWITTGFTPEQVRERYGDGIARRVFEGALIIDCGAKS